MTVKQFETQIKIRVRDTKDDSKSEFFTDTYSLIINDGQLVHCDHSYSKQNGPLNIKINLDDIQLKSIPRNVAYVMQKYTDGIGITWPKTYNTQQGEVRGSEIQVNLTSLTKDDQGEIVKEDTYKFTVYNDKYVEASKDGNSLKRDDILPSVRKEAEQYIPSGLNYLGENQTT